MQSIRVQANVESAEGFACNAHCPDTKHVIIDAACIETARVLADAGYDVRRVDTSEFRKSGGSVFCMKMMIE